VPQRFNPVLGFLSVSTFESFAHFIDVLDVSIPCWVF